MSTDFPFFSDYDEIYEGVQGVTTLVDDKLVYGKTREEQYANLRIAVGLTESPYFGHIQSTDGLKPDPGKIIAICDMGHPRDRKELETVLGIINYVAKFSPNLSEITHPMLQLLYNTSEG